MGRLAAVELARAAIFILRFIACAATGAQDKDNREKHKDNRPYRHGAPSRRHATPHHATTPPK